MKRNAGGFTLIELIVVIVVLGILAATAMPKFIDVKSDAGAAAVAGVAGGLSAASAVNYAGKQLNKNVTPASISAAAATSCAGSTAYLGGLLTAGWPAGYTAGVSTGSTRTCAADGVIDCLITADSGGYTAVAAITCY